MDTISPTTTTTVDQAAAEAAFIAKLTSGRDTNGSQLVDVLKNYQDNYLKNFIDAASINTAFIADLANLLKTLSDATTPGSDSNHINFSAIPAMNAITALMTKYGTSPLYTAKATGEAGLQEATEWAKELGLNPDVCVAAFGKDAAGNPMYWVTVDTTPLITMKNAIDAKNGNLNTAEYQALQAVFDAQKAVMQNYAQILMEKLSKANSCSNTLQNMVLSYLAEYMQRCLEILRST